MSRVIMNIKDYFGKVITFDAPLLPEELKLPLEYTLQGPFNVLCLILRHDNPVSGTRLDLDGYYSRESLSNDKFVDVLIVYSIVDGGEIDYIDTCTRYFTVDNFLRLAAMSANTSRSNFRWANASVRR